MPRVIRQNLSPLLRASILCALALSAQANCQQARASEKSATAERTGASAKDAGAIAKARDLAAKGYQSQALKILDEIIARSPNCTDAIIERGNTYFNARQFDLAARDMQKAVRLIPNYQHGYVLLGICAGSQDRLNQALQLDDKAIACGGPETGTAYRSKSLHLLKIGKLQEAKANILMAFKKDEKQPHLKPFNEAAMAEIDEALETNPKPTTSTTLQSRPELEQARALWKAGKQTACITALDALLKKHPDCADAYLMKGDVYCETLDYEKACPPIRQAIILQPKLQHAYFILGRCQFQQRHFHQALELFNQALTAEGAEARLIHREKSALLLTMHRTNEALDEINAALKLDRGPLQKHEDLMNRCAIYQTTHEWSKQLADVDEMLPLKDGKDYHDWILRGEAHANLGALDKSVRDYKMSLRLNPNNVFALQGLIKTYEKMGDHKNADAIKKQIKNGETSTF